MVLLLLVGTSLCENGEQLRLSVAALFSAHYMVPSLGFPLPSRASCTTTSSPLGWARLFGIFVVFMGLVLKEANIFVTDVALSAAALVVV